MKIEELHNNLGASSNNDAPRHDPFDDDYLTNLHVSKTLISHELDLFKSKWFDYRQLTPLQATRVYIDSYEEPYRRHFATNFDKNIAKFIKPISVESIMAGLREMQEPEPEGLTALAKKERDKRIYKARTALIGCWRGRQCADYLGMPYGVYIDLALTYRLNYWNRNNMPQPTHLYSKMVVEKIQERWPELQERKLFLSDDPAYLVQNFRGIGHQKDYHEWLIAQAQKRSNPPFFLAQFINDDLLPMELVELRFDEFTVERVNRHLLH